jgi:hypothetical protein
VLAFFVISFGKFGEGQSKRSGALPIRLAEACAVGFPAWSRQFQTSRILSDCWMSFSTCSLLTTSTNHASNFFLSPKLPSTEPFAGSEFAKLNRQTQGIEHVVTYRKQRTANSSNRQNIQKCPLDISSISKVAE